MVSTSCRSAGHLIASAGAQHSDCVKRAALLHALCNERLLTPGLQNTAAAAQVLRVPEPAPQQSDGKAPAPAPGSSGRGAQARPGAPWGACISCACRDHVWLPLSKQRVSVGVYFPVDGTTPTRELFPTGVLVVSTNTCQRTAVTGTIPQAGAGQRTRAGTAGSAPAVTDLDWTMDNDRLLAAAEDGSVCVWLIDSGQLVRAKAAQAVTHKNLK
jgi:hypothetical protein